MAWWYPRTTNRIATYVAITGITTLSKISFVSIRVLLGKLGKLPGSISTLNAQISILMNEIKKNQSTILNKNKEDIVNRIQSNNVKAFAEMQMQLPDKEYIESTAKKYAMYLHDEHVEIMNLTRDDDTISIASTRAESVQAIPTPKEVPVPRLCPIKFAPPPLSGYLS